MPIVSSGGALQALTPAPRTPPVWTTPTVSSSWSIAYEHDPATYAALYRSQPSVRTVIDFLARNCAQIPCHVFRRVSDTDRERLADHQLADWLTEPTPFATRYRLFETLLQDLGVYFNAFWLKVRERDRIALQRLPPEEMCVEGGLVPMNFRWTTSTGEIFNIPPSEIVFFSGYNPNNPRMGLSPLETLRRLLAEDIAAQDHREHLWRNGARIEGIIERPKGAKPWDTEQIDDFRTQWRAKFSGGPNAGSVPVLQDGATYKPIGFSPRQAEYSQVRKLTLEEVIRAYHMPLTMLGLLEHATYSNITEQHKQLYQDALGPWLKMIEEEIERQLLPECADTDRVYVEFNISEKLKGSFEEQAGALQTLVGAPIMTRNEGRARLNLPSIDDPGADGLVRPLNTTATDGEVTRPDDDAIAVAPVIARAWSRQRTELAKADPALRALAFDDERWTRELVTDLVPLYKAAGYDEHTAHRRAGQLARIVNTDTRTLLAAGVAAFTNREAEAYVA